MNDGNDSNLRLWQLLLRDIVVVFVGATMELSQAFSEHPNEPVLAAGVSLLIGPPLMRSVAKARNGVGP